MILALCGKQLIDGTGQGPIKDGVIVVEGDRITSVGPYESVTIPGDARIVELREHTLAPGLIDAHSHTSIQTIGSEKAEVAGSQEGEVIVWAVYWLGKDLRSGVTTMRTLGDRRFMGSVFKKAQQAGRILAPRLQIAEHALVSSLGSVSSSDAYADGTDALLRWIRDSVRGGAEWVKFHGTPNSRAPDPTLPLFSRREVEVIFEEARRNGRPVAVHCHGGLAADWCIELGVDSLEHGLYLEEYQFCAMGEKGIILVPTTGVALLQPDEGATPRLIETKSRARSFLREARRHGVNCIPGTDAVHGQMALELRLMIDSGWSPMEAIQAATREASNLLRLSDKIGTLEPGKWADVVAFRGDPLKDPEALGAVDLVVQGGRIVHRDLVVG